MVRGQCVLTQQLDSYKRRSNGREECGTFRVVHTIRIDAKGPRIVAQQIDVLRAVSADFSSVGNHTFWSNVYMAGDFIGYRRSDSGLMTGRLQAKGPRWYSWLVPICISLLVVCGIVSVLISQTASTNNASPRRKPIFRLG